MPGVRLAEAGEFTRRAFEAGKLDLAAVEGLADLIDSETEWQRRQALRQMEGALGELAERWRERLIEAMALLEAEIDFSDEGDVSGPLVAEAMAIVAEMLASFARALGSFAMGERVREGFVVVLAGPPNAGKSSLLNALARRDVAIVSPVAGTTRDAIEVRLDLARSARHPRRYGGAARQRRSDRGRRGEAGAGPGRASRSGVEPARDRFGSGSNRRSMRLRPGGRHEVGSDRHGRCRSELPVSVTSGAGVDELLAAIVERSRRTRPVPSPPC